MSLPSGYTELAYLKFTGTQYIELPFIADQNTRVVMDCQYTGTLDKGQTFPFGSRIGPNNRSFSPALVTGQVFYSYGSSYSFADYANLNERMVIDANKNVCTFTGSQVATITLAAATFTTPSNLFIGTFYQNGTIFTGSEAWNGLMWHTYVYDNDVLVYHLVPALRNSDGVVGYYDTVNHVLHENAGTGAFFHNLTPVGDHNTNIGGVAREVEGMAVRMGGVLREVNRGTMLANGVAREVAFVPSSYTITTGKALSTGYTKYSTSLNGATLADNSVYTVEPGTQIMISVQAGQYITIYVRVNGSTVATASPNSSKTYTYTVNSDITINSTSNGTFVYYDITTS